MPPGRSPVQRGLPRRPARYTTFSPPAQYYALLARNTRCPTPGPVHRRLAWSRRPPGRCARWSAGPASTTTSTTWSPRGLRQPGSSFKMIVLMAALENGIVPDDNLDGGSPSFPNPGGAPDPLRGVELRRQSGRARHDHQPHHRVPRTAATCAQPDRGPGQGRRDRPPPRDHHAAQPGRHVDADRRARGPPHRDGGHGGDHRQRWSLQRAVLHRAHRGTATAT